VLSNSLIIAKRSMVIIKIGWTKVKKSTEYKKYLITAGFLASFAFGFFLNSIFVQKPINEIIKAKIENKTI
jgi:hypothetical protein